jgi:hypothetical protein
VAELKFGHYRTQEKNKPGRNTRSRPEGAVLQETLGEMESTWPGAYMVLDCVVEAGAGRSPPGAASYLEAHLA